ncbi:MAG: metallophosphoesterase [Fimbriimonadaceae bacterium]|jgi:hypothetical protein|nr:metallophosphoesterase [Fimbriimonadaceae bacterium]
MPISSSTIFWGGLGVCAGLLGFGALVEAYDLKPEAKKLTLKDWPNEKSGFRLGLLADLHLGPSSSFVLLESAVSWLASQKPDVVVLAGDLICHWRHDTLTHLRRHLSLLSVFGVPVLAIAGNHDYYYGDAEDLRPVLEDLGIRLLINEVATLGGVNFLGVDSGNEGNPDPYSPLFGADLTLPTIALWHEPDLVDLLPRGLDLMVSGHSHGGQFVFPWGWAPTSPRNGRKYLRGFFPEAPTPLYVSRGVATTGPPSRFCCPPEVTVLTLVSPLHGNHLTQ